MPPVTSLRCPSHTDSCPVLGSLPPNVTRSQSGPFRTKLSRDELHAIQNLLLKCLSHARDHAASVWQPHAVWLCFCPPWASVLEETDPCAGSHPGSGGRVSSGTCACGTAPPTGPGIEVSRSAAGRGAPAGRWHWLALGGPGSASDPGSLLELGRSGPETWLIIQKYHNATK